VTPLPLPVMLLLIIAVGYALGGLLNRCILIFPRYESLRDQMRHVWSQQHVVTLRSDVMRGRFLSVINGLLLAVLYWFEVPTTEMADASGLFTSLGPEIYRDLASDTAMAAFHFRYLFHAVLIEFLLIATVIDFDHHIIPDGCTVPAMLVGLGGSLSGLVYLVPVLFHESAYQYHFPTPLNALFAGPRVASWIENYPMLHGLAVSLVGLGVGGATVWAVRIIGHWVLRQEAMGFGDVILMAMVGSFIGWQPVVYVFILAPFCVLLVLPFSIWFLKGKEIPYGPYLSMATLLLLLSWKKLWPIAETYFNLGVLMPLVLVLTAGIFVLLLQIVQLAKYCLGIPLYPDEWEQTWNSADQLVHHPNASVEQQPQAWKINSDWPGVATSQGTYFKNRWQNR